METSVCAAKRQMIKGGSKVAAKRPHLQLPTAEDIVSKMSGTKYFSKLDASSGYWQA